MKIVFCGIWSNYNKKIKKKLFSKFQQKYVKNAKMHKNAKIIKIIR